MKAKYFKLEEFTRSATAQRLGIGNTPSEEAVKNLSHLVWNVLDPLRERWGSAIIVNSGFRCEELNKAVGGAKASYHRLGMAADIRPRNGRLAELYDLIHAMFREGKLGVMDYYNMQNVISDTEMRNAISKSTNPQKDKKEN